MNKFISILATLFIMSIEVVRSYDYYILAVELPGTVCKSRDCNYLDSLTSTSINMHGLWPNYNNGSYPQFCTEDKYDPSKLTSETISLLNSNWAGLYSDSNNFRSHEWEKHGTCFQNNQIKIKSFLRILEEDEKMNEYFQTAIKVKQSTGLENLLFTQDSWEAKDLISKVSSSLGVNQFKTTCKHGDLQGFFFCYDLSLKAMDCPNEEHGTNCNGQINVPKLNN